MDGWSLALEAGHPAPGSELSDDGGSTWRRERMGYLNAVLAEYVVRVRLAEGRDPPPAAMVWEEPGSPRVRSLRERLPAGAREEGETLDRTRVLSSWLAAAWESMAEIQSAGPSIGARIEFGMFPGFGDPGYFDDPPEGFPG